MKQLEHENLRVVFSISIEYSLINMDVNECKALYKEFKEIRSKIDSTFKLHINPKLSLPVNPPLEDFSLFERSEEIALVLKNECSVCLNLQGKDLEELEMSVASFEDRKNETK